MKLLILSLGLVLFAACQPSLDHQPRTKPHSPSPQFADGSSARPQLPGTVEFYKESTPEPKLTPELLALGRKKFEINCAVCHGYAGEGNGLITQRGYPPLKSFVDEHVSKKPNTNLFQTIFDGKNEMPAFGAKLTNQEIFAVLHYVRVLTLRGQVPLEFLSALDKQKLREVSP